MRLRQNMLDWSHQKSVILRALSHGVGVQGSVHLDQCSLAFGLSDRHRRDFLSQAPLTSTKQQPIQPFSAFRTLITLYE